MKHFDGKDRIAGQPSWGHKFGQRAIPSHHPAMKRPTGVVSSARFSKGSRKG